MEVIRKDTGIYAVSDVEHLTPGADKNTALLRGLIYRVYRVPTVFFHILVSAIIPTAPGARIPSCHPLDPVLST